MKVIKVLAGLLSLSMLIAGGYFVYQDQESIELSDQLRKTMPGSFAKTPQGVVHYQLAGPKDADLVVLVHGFSVPSFLWEPTIHFLLDEGYQVLSFDLFGRGLSDRPDAEFGMELFSSQLKHLLTALDITQPINLVGLSMGGPVVSRFTHQYPQLVKKLILQDPVVHQIPNEVYSPLDKPLVGEYFAAVVFIPRLIALNNRPENEKKVKGWGEKFTEQTQYKGFRRAILSSIRYLTSHRLVAEYEALAKVNIPKLLVWGTEDQTIPMSESATLIALMPTMQFVSIDGAGHIPSVEAPEAFNAALLQFLKEN